MKKYITLSSIVALGLLTSSCIVSRKKYDELDSKYWATMFSRDSLGNLLNLSRKQSDSLAYMLNTSRTQCLGLLTDTTSLRNELRSYLSKLNSANAENEKLNQQLASKNKALDAGAKTISEMQKIIDEQNKKVQDLFDNVKNALMGFNSDELTVREEGGKIYVAMSDKLLFESASAQVNDLGKEALGKLADVLNKQVDIDVYIEGHTDSIPIKTAVFKDNWDLSVIRATSVVRILTETYSVNPLQIQPSGRGEYKPIDTNSTPEGRAKNRRTEIIMAPRLDKLYEMLKN